MRRTALLVLFTLVGPAAFANDGKVTTRDMGRTSTSFTSDPALHRAALLGEVARGERKLFAHDPLVAEASDPQNQFLIVRDKYASSEHALGIFTPPGREQPAHIKDVTQKDASHLGRMIRTLLFADHASDRAPAGGFADWQLYVNLSPAVPRLHVHAQPGSAPHEKISDWNAFAEKHGYSLRTTAAYYKVWQWTRSDRAPHDWKVLAVGDAKLGTPAKLDELSEAQAKSVDHTIGSLWIEAAKYTSGAQIEASRNDSQIVARGVGW